MDKVRHEKRRTRMHQTGFSLVEMMVALVMGLIVMGGVIQIFVSSKLTFNMSDDFSMLQENVRFAVDTLDYDIRMAGHWGGVGDEMIKVVSTFSGNCSVLIGDVKKPIEVIEGAASPPSSVSACIGSTDYIANSDILIVRYGDANGRTTTAGVDGGTVYVRALPARATEVRIGSDMANSKIPDDAAGKYTVFNYPYNVALYFVSPCSDATGCSASSDDGDPIPTLSRYTLSGSSLTLQPLVQGVETLQIELGLGDTKKAGLPIESYKDADEMAATDWPKISSVRLSVLARSRNIAVGYEDPEGAAGEDGYELVGNDTADKYKPVGDALRYPRRVITHTVKVRNRGKS